MSTFSSNMDALVARINSGGYDAILVEGYDCVGKGRVIEELSKRLFLPVYRPTYDYIRNNLPREYRWIINWSYFDIIKKTGVLRRPLIFDRSMISAAVYNSDRRIMRELENVSKGMKILCVLVTVPLGDYPKFAEVRGMSPNRVEYIEYLNRFYSYLDESSIEYTGFLNRFDEEYSKKVSGTCASCDHYDGKECTHPKVHAPKDPSTPLCEYSKDKGV